MRPRAAAVLVLTLFASAISSCGGSRVGDEELFAGAPLPDEEPVIPRATSSSSVAAEPPKPPSCDHPPPRGFERCDPQKSNVPCVYGDVGGCLVRCERCDGKPGCVERAPMPAACPPPG